MTERRRRNRLIRRLLVFGPAILVVIVGALSYAWQRREAGMSSLVLHTRDVIATASELLNTLLMSESSVRGYLISGDTAMLAPLHGTHAKTDSLLGRLRVLTVDNSAQQQRLDTLMLLTRQRLARFDTLAAQAKPGAPMATVGGVTDGARGTGPR